MFYTKTAIGNTTIETEINDETVFTRCPHCGKEIPVDLQELFEQGFDLGGTAVFCTDCSVHKEGQ